MKIGKNVGRLDSYLRLMMGFSMLGYGITKKSDLMILLGAGKIAEGITRFCPMMYAFGITTVNNRIEHMEKTRA
ncbi:MAG: DUF2892 domain-containing protein [Tepidanaerobacteraceae bacterium]|jgi:uncharacterized membrane protein|nr:DUF2892 domain-containing protein [Tepidanaerobacteraceae bacterium]